MKMEHNDYEKNRKSEYDDEETIPKYPYMKILMDIEKYGREIVESSNNSTFSSSNQRNFTNLYSNKQKSSSGLGFSKKPTKNTKSTKNKDIDVDLFSQVLSAPVNILNNNKSNILITNDQCQSKNNLKNVYFSSSASEIGHVQSNKMNNNLYDYPICICFSNNLYKNSNFSHGHCHCHGLTNNYNNLYIKDVSLSQFNIINNGFPFNQVGSYDLYRSYTSHGSFNNFINYSSQIINTCNNQSISYDLILKINQNPKFSKVYILPYISNDNLLQIVCNQYGNNVIQKIITTTDSSSLKSITEMIISKILLISVDQYGNRVIQKLIERLNTENNNEIIDKLTNNISNHVSSLLVNNKFGIYIIRTCISILTDNQVSKIYKEIKKNLVLICKDKEGVLNMKSIIKLSIKSRKISLINKILKNSMKLIFHPYSNVILQFLVKENSNEIANPFSAEYVISKIHEKINQEGRILSLACEKISSVFLKFCIDSTNDIDLKEKIIETFLFSSYINEIIEDKTNGNLCK